MKPFFITGLPRSRTKWFSEYFSGISGVFCMHQGLNGCYSEKSLLNKMSHVDSEYVGNSDSLLLMMNLSEYPAVIVDRDIEEVLYSLSENTDIILDEELIRRYRFMGKLKDKMPGFHIPFREINANLDLIHEYLIDIPFDSHYASEMVRTNVQTHTAEMIHMITRYRIVEPRLAAS